MRLRQGTLSFPLFTFLNGALFTEHIAVIILRVCWQGLTTESADGIIIWFKRRADAVIDVVTTHLAPFSAQAITVCSILPWVAIIISAHCSILNRKSATFTINHPRTCLA